MEARLRATGFREATRQVGVMGDRARAVRPVLISRYTKQDFQDTSKRKFDRGLRRDSAGWLLEKRKRGLDRRPMRATNAAYNAIVNGSGKPARAIQFKADNTMVEFGIKRGRSDLYYVNVHDKGYKSKKGQVPRRRVIGLNKNDRARPAIARRVEVYVTTGRVVR